MRRTAAVVETQAACSARAMRRQARSANAGASFSPLKRSQVQELLRQGSVLLSNSAPNASRPSPGRHVRMQRSQFVVPAAGSTSVPSIMCGTGGGRGRQRGSSEEQGVWRRECGSVKARAESGARKVLPNPSFKLSTAGRPPGPVWRYAVHCRQPGPGVLPSAPA